MSKCELVRLNRQLWVLAIASLLIGIGACRQSPPAPEPKVANGQVTTESEYATTSAPDTTTDNGSSVTESSPPATGQSEMTTGNGKRMVLTLQTLKEARGFQYCELVFDYGETGMDIYSTSPLAPADLEWWEQLDQKALAREFGAKSVFKNGPQWWSMDEVSVMASEPVQVAGVQMVFGAHLPAGTLSIPKYTVFSPAKTQNLLWKSGKPVYQLIDPDGHVYVLQGHKVPTESLAALDERFRQLPEGWKYEVRILAADLRMKLTPDVPIPSVQDEFDQIYIRIPE